MMANIKHNAVNGVIGVFIVNLFLLTPLQEEPWLCFYLSLCVGLVPMGFDWR